MRNRLIGIFLSLFLFSCVVFAVPTEIKPSTTTQNGDGAFIWYPLNSGGHFYNASVDGSQLLIVNTTTTTTAKVQNITILAGEYWRGALGDKLFQLPTNHTYVLGPFESSWFKQANGTVMVSTNSTRGHIALIQMP
jgi:hypothetical protein